MKQFKSLTEAIKYCQGNDLPFIICITECVNDSREEGEVNFKIFVDDRFEPSWEDNELKIFPKDYEFMESPTHDVCNLKGHMAVYASINRVKYTGDTKFYACSLEEIIKFNAAERAKKSKKFTQDLEASGFFSSW